MRLSTVPVIALVGMFAAGCSGSSQKTEEAASPVQLVNRSQERLLQSATPYVKQNENGNVVGKVFAPGPAVWEALVGAMNDRKVNLTILDRSIGRLGDTAMVVTRRWNNKPMSNYFTCGESMTGLRANEDRLRAVFLAQMSRSQSDTIAVSVHFSAFATPLSSGGSGSTAECISTGKGEAELLDDVIRRVGGTGTRH